MLTEIINFTSTELNSGTVIAKTITPRTLDYLYKPSSIEIYNASGATVNIGLFTVSEYSYWTASYSVSNLIPITNSTTRIVNNFKGAVSKIVASGLVGSPYTSGLTCTVIEEYA